MGMVDYAMDFLFVDYAQLSVCILLLNWNDMKKHEPLQTSLGYSSIIEWVNSVGGWGWGGGGGKH